MVTMCFPYFVTQLAFQTASPCEPLPESKRVPAICNNYCILRHTHVAPLGSLFYVMGIAPGGDSGYASMGQSQMQRRHTAGQTCAVEGPSRSAENPRRWGLPRIRLAHELDGAAQRAPTFAIPLVYPHRTNGKTAGRSSAGFYLSLS